MYYNVLSISTKIFVFENHALVHLYKNSHKALAPKVNTKTSGSN